MRSQGAARHAGHGQAPAVVTSGHGLDGVLGSELADRERIEVELAVGDEQIERRDGLERAHRGGHLHRRVLPAQLLARRGEQPVDGLVEAEVDAQRLGDSRPRRG
jgi:hypothetical protein